MFAYSSSENLHKWYNYSCILKYKDGLVYLSLGFFM
jgi:hypothetical protein